MKVSLFDVRKRIQIIVKKASSESRPGQPMIEKTKDIFGSVTFSLKKLSQAKPGLNYIHWVSLYDSLDDDLYDG